MPETRLKCPSCEAILKLSAPVAPGKAIKCPKCGAAIRVPAAAGKSSGPAAVVARAAPRPQPVRKAEPEEEPDEEVEYVEEEEEAPRSKKKTQRAVEDEEDSDERPRKRRKKLKKKRGNPALLWGLVGGGVGLVVIAVVVLFATGVIGPKKSKNLAGEIVGKWEYRGTEVLGTAIFEFQADGTLTLTVSGPGGGSAVVTGKYKVITDDEIEMHGNFFKEAVDTRGTVTINGDEMTIKDYKGRRSRFTRVK